MANFGSILAGAASGFGAGLSQIAAQQQKVLDETALLREKAQLEEEKALRIAERTSELETAAQGPRAAARAAAEKQAASDAAYSDFLAGRPDSPELKAEYGAFKARAREATVAGLEAEAKHKTSLAGEADAKARYYGDQKSALEQARIDALKAGKDASGTSAAAKVLQQSFDSASKEIRSATKEIVSEGSAVAKSLKAKYGETWQQEVNSTAEALWRFSKLHDPEGSQLTPAQAQEMMLTGQKVKKVSPDGTRTAFGVKDSTGEFHVYKVTKSSGGAKTPPATPPTGKTPPPAPPNLIRPPGSFGTDPNVTADQFGRPVMKAKTFADTLRDVLGS